MDLDLNIDKLKKESEAHKAALTSEINNWVERSKRITIGVLLIGGGLSLAYLISKRFTAGKNGDQNPVEQQTSAKISKISRFILQELSVFLLAMAKERLLKYLEETNTDEEINSGNTE
ncbi:MAG: hypothetical protein AAFX57_17400 [Bacteroidota bacterium]